MSTPIQHSLPPDAEELHRQREEKLGRAITTIARHQAFILNYGKALTPRLSAIDYPTVSELLPTGKPHGQTRLLLNTERRIWQLSDQLCWRLPSDSRDYLFLTTHANLIRGGYATPSRELVFENKPLRNAQEFFALYDGLQRLESIAFVKRKHTRLFKLDDERRAWITQTYELYETLRRP